MDKAVTILRQGGIIIYPTDTAFGIGCRIDAADAVERLFMIRKRPLNQPTPVLISSREMAEKYFADIIPAMAGLMTRYWPGALTVIGRCDPEKIYSPVRGGTETIGLRMPDNETILGIIRSLSLPILGPSANFHGQPTPYRFEDLDPELVKLVDFVVPGKCKAGTVSTVVDCTVVPYKIIRHGAVTL